MIYLNLTIKKVQNEVKYNIQVKKYPSKEFHREVYLFPDKNEVFISEDIPNNARLQWNDAENAVFICKIENPLNYVFEDMNNTPAAYYEILLLHRIAASVKEFFMTELLDEIKVKIKRYGIPSKKYHKEIYYLADENKIVITNEIENGKKSTVADNENAIFITSIYSKDLYDVENSDDYFDVVLNHIEDVINELISELGFNPIYPF